MQIVILDYLPLTTVKTLRIILIFQLEISRLMRICYPFLFNRYTYLCVSYIKVISDRIGHTLFKQVTVHTEPLVTPREQLRSHCSDEDNCYAIVSMSLTLSFNKSVLGCVITIIMFYNGLHVNLLSLSSPWMCLKQQTAASVLLKLFISSYKWRHTTDAP